MERKYKLIKRSLLTGAAVVGLSSVNVLPVDAGIDSNGYVSFGAGAGTNISDGGPNQVLLDGGGEVQLNLQFKGSAEGSFHRPGDRTYIYMPDSANRNLVAFSPSGIGLAGFDPSKPDHDPGNPWHGFEVPNGDYSLIVKELNHTPGNPLKVGVGVMSEADAVLNRSNFIDLANLPNPNTAPAAVQVVAPAAPATSADIQPGFTPPPTYQVENAPRGVYFNPIFNPSQFDKEHNFGGNWGWEVQIMNPNDEKLANQVLYTSPGVAKELFLSGNFVGLNFKWNAQFLSRWAGPGNLAAILVFGDKSDKFDYISNSGQGVAHVENYLTWNTQPGESEFSGPVSGVVINPNRNGEVFMRSSDPNGRFAPQIALKVDFIKWTPNDQGKGLDKTVMADLTNALIYS